MSSNVIVTNTTTRPVFVAGRMLGVGASLECDAAQVPACLKPTKKADTQDAVQAMEQENTPPKTDEDLLVEAAKAKKQ